MADERQKELRMALGTFFKKTYPYKVLNIRTFDTEYHVTKLSSDVGKITQFNDEDVVTDIFDDIICRKDLIIFAKFDKQVFKIDIDDITRWDSE